MVCAHGWWSWVMLVLYTSVENVSMTLFVFCKIKWERPFTPILRLSAHILTYIHTKVFNKVFGTYSDLHWHVGNQNTHTFTQSFTGHINDPHLLEDNQHGCWAFFQIGNKKTQALEYSHTKVNQYMLTYIQTKVIHSMVLREFIW